MGGIKRKILNRRRFRPPHTPMHSNGSISLELECGHIKYIKASQEPKEFAYCKECMRINNPSTDVKNGETEIHETQR